MTDLLNDSIENRTRFTENVSPSWFLSLSKALRNVLNLWVCINSMDPWVSSEIGFQNVQTALLSHADLPWGSLCGFLFMTDEYLAFHFMAWLSGRRQKLRGHKSWKQVLCVFIQILQTVGIITWWLQKMSAQD